MKLDRIAIADGPFLDAQDYELRKGYLLTPELALFFDEGRLILRYIEKYEGTGEHTHLYVSRELAESVRVAIDETESVSTVLRVAKRLQNMSAIDFLIDCVMHDPDAVDEFNVVR